MGTSFLLRVKITDSLLSRSAKVDVGILQSRIYEITGQSVSRRTVMGDLQKMRVFFDCDIVWDRNKMSYKYNNTNRENNFTLNKFLVDDDEIEAIKYISNIFQDEEYQSVPEITRVLGVFKRILKEQGVVLGGHKNKEDIQKQKPAVNSNSNMMFLMTA